jgi:allantoinase
LSSYPLLPQHKRYDYIPLPERRDYSWPGGKRLAFVITTNVEWFAYGAGLGHDPAKTGEPQTHRNYSWRDYGNRIGIWRFFDLLDELALPAGHNCNSLLYHYAPQIMAAIRARGDEVVAHGRTNAENLRGMWEADEARLIREATDVIAQAEGKRPKGWMGSGAYETPNTLDLLQELGYEYSMDWPMDDQPVWLRTRSGPLLSVPYPIELNDSQVVIHRKQDAGDFCSMITEQFDEMIEQCVKHPLVMNVSVHPYVFGQPFRLRMLRRALKHCVEHSLKSRVWWAKPEEISDYCRTLPAGVVPGS